MSFTDFIRLQNDAAHALLSDAYFANVNIVTRERVIEDGSRLEDQNLAAETTVYTTPRNDKQGLGIIVEKPEFVAKLPNVPGPQGDLVLTFLLLEDWTENLGPNGTGIAADQGGQKILDLLHLWVVEGVGPLASEGLFAARDWEPLRAYRARLRVTASRGQTDRVARVAMAVATGNCTLTCATAGSAIYWTNNGSAPAPSNNGAHLYTAPFAVSNGQEVRAAAFKSGMNQSAVARLII